MDRHIEHFHALAHKYWLASPIPAPVQEQAIRSGRKNLARTLKQSGLAAGGMLYVLWVFRILRNAGMKASVAHAKIAGAAVAAHIAASVAVTGYTAIKIAIGPPGSPPREKTEAASALPGTMSGSLFTKTPSFESIGTVQNAVGIMPFSGADKAVASEISMLCTKKVAEKLGAVQVVPIISVQPPAVEQIIVGSVRTLGNETIITIKIIEMKTSKVSFITSSKVSQANRTDEACDTLARELAGAIKKN